MKKEEFIEKMAVINAVQQKAREDERALIKEYLESHRRFPNGSKIKITRPERVLTTMGGPRNGEKTTAPAVSRFAYVRGIELSYENQPKYLLQKAKKDGSISRNSDHYGSIDILELA